MLPNARAVLPYLGVKMAALKTQPNVAVWGGVQPQGVQPRRATCIRPREEEEDPKWERSINILHSCIGLNGCSAKGNPCCSFAVCDRTSCCACINHVTYARMLHHVIAVISWYDLSFCFERIWNHAERSNENSFAHLA